MKVKISMKLLNTKNCTLQFWWFFDKTICLVEIVMAICYKNNINDLKEIPKTNNNSDYRLSFPVTYFQNYLLKSENYGLFNQSSLA